MSAHALAGKRLILPAPPQTELERCRMLLAHAKALFAASGRGLDPREFKSGRCTAGKRNNQCGNVANVTRPRCAFHTAIEEGIEVKMSGMNVGLGAFASGHYRKRDHSGPVVFRKGEIICEVSGSAIDIPYWRTCSRHS